MTRESLGEQMFRRLLFRSQLFGQFSRVVLRRWERKHFAQFSTGFLFFSFTQESCILISGSSNLPPWTLFGQWERWNKVVCLVTCSLMARKSNDYFQLLCISDIPSSIKYIRVNFKACMQMAISESLKLRNSQKWAKFWTENLTFSRKNSSETCRSRAALRVFR